MRQHNGPSVRGFRSLGRFAQTLAKQSGLDYAIMTGGDVGPLGKEAVHEINKLSPERRSATSGRGRGWVSPSTSLRGNMPSHSVFSPSAYLRTK